MSHLLVVILVFVVLTIIGVPLYASVGVATAVALLLIHIPLTLLTHTAFTALEPFPLLTIPMFVLAGRLMEVGGMAERLIHVARTLAGSYRGSLGLVTVIACTLFAALSGSGPATTAAIGSTTIPAMIDEGYSKRFAAALSASGGALGSVIPPSNLLIIYGLVSDQSIPRLFLAGIVPGLFVSCLLLVASYTQCVRFGYGGAGESFSALPFLKALWDGKWAIGAPVIILGGIYGGIFTPTEAGAVAVVYALVVGWFVYRNLTLKRIWDSLRFTILISGLLIILTPTIAFGQLAAFYNVPQAVEKLLLHVSHGPITAMIIMGLFFIFTGTFMESIAQIILFVPIFLPTATHFGISPVVFGVFTVMTCEIGFLTPPLGANLNVAARLTGISIEDVSIGAIGFIAAYMVGLMFIILAPHATSALPQLVYGANY